MGAAAQDLTQFVNPFVGTAGFGNVYPGAQVPFGGIQISPDTDDYDYDVAAGYKYTKPTVMGFSLTHLSGTGIPDLGDFMFVPGDIDTADVPLNHDAEHATPGYYSLDFKGVKSEMTASARSGILRFTYPGEAALTIDLKHTLRWKCVWASVRQVDEYTIVGSKLVNGWNPNRQVFFAARFS
jgi:putative alpha-1,2-mannosidase